MCGTWPEHTKTLPPKFRMQRHTFMNLKCVVYLPSGLFPTWTDIVDLHKIQGCFCIVLRYYFTKKDHAPRIKPYQFPYPYSSMLSRSLCSCLAVQSWQNSGLSSFDTTCICPPFAFDMLIWMTFQLHCPRGCMRCAPFGIPRHTQWRVFSGFVL